MAKPVVRGYIIPRYVSGDRVIITERIDGPDAYSHFKNIFNKVAQRFISRDRKISTLKDLNNLLDCFIIYLKYLLYMDPISVYERPIIVSPIYFLLEYICEKKIENKDLKPIYKREGLKKFIKDTVNRYRESPPRISKELRGDIDIALRMPADTRPAANTSSLVIHLLTTSSIATSIYISRTISNSFSMKEMTKIRLLGLFHDMGKFHGWQDHESKSGDMLKEWFIDSRLVADGSRAYQVINECINILKAKGGGSEAYEIVKLADRLGSGLDRVLRHLAKYLSDGLKNKLLDEINDYFKVEYPTLQDALQDSRVTDNWIFWNEHLDIEFVEELTRDFCLNIGGVEDRPIQSNRVLSEEVEIVRLDIKGIQKFIKTNDLRSMMGGSRLIDIIVFASLPYLIMDLHPGIPAENILVSGGGNLTAILPRGFKGEIENKLRNEFDLGVSIKLGVSRLYEDYGMIEDEINRNLSLSKIYSLEGPGIIIDSILDRCEFCGEEPASETIGKGAEEIHVCKKCKFKYDVGDTEYFTHRLDLMSQILKKEHWMELLWRDFIIFIAGNPIDVGIARQLNLACVKFDGNLIGSFMSRSLSITDSFERSFRIDHSLKTAISEFFDFILKYANVKQSMEIYDDVLRFVLGYMYVGGDDGTLLMPSYLSIPFAVYVVNRYFQLTGGRSTLSVGVVATKPKHPLIQLYEAADSLLDHSKETGGRAETYDKIYFKPSDVLGEEFRGSISYLYIDTGRISGWYTGEILRIMDSDRLSTQSRYSYLVSKIDNEFSIFRLLTICGLWNQTKNMNDRDDYEAMLYKLYDSNIWNRELGLRREIVHDTLSANVSGDHSIMIKLAFMTAKGKDAFRVVKNRIIGINELIRYLVYRGGSKYYIRLLDLDMLIKFLMRGGE